MENFRFEVPPNRDYFFDSIERFCFNTARVDDAFPQVIRKSLGVLSACTRHQYGANLSPSLSLKLEVQRTCPLTSKVGSLHASNIFRPFHIVRQQYSKMDNSGLKGPQIETIFSDFIGRFCFKNPGTKKCPKRAIVFQFFLSFFLFLFVLKLLPDAANYGN